MPTLQNYRGLQVVSPEPTGDGGLAIQNDFKHLVDWHPRSVWNEIADPTSGDDEGDSFYPGSLWLRTDTTPPKLFVCRSATLGAAVWDRLAWHNVSVPYTGATGNVDLGTHKLISRGLDAGFVQDAPALAAQFQNYWFARTADLAYGWILDYQDELAHCTVKGATATMTPTPTGFLPALFQANSDTVRYAAGTSPSPAVIEIDYPILAAGNQFFALGLTYRNAPSLTPSHIKIEFQAIGTSSYVTVFDQAVAPATDRGAWISPLVALPSAPYDLQKVRLTLTLPTPLAGEFILQRVMLYHSTGEFDPWKVSTVGGVAYGQFRIAGPLATATSVKTANYTLTERDSVVLANATGGAITITLPSAVGYTGLQYTVKRINGGTNNVTVATSDSQTIDGATTRTLSTQYETVTVVSDNANWHVI